ncbi:unnamed protein product, partial [Ectocarpus sp. 12 AP-2014]
DSRVDAPTACNLTASSTYLFLVKTPYISAIFYISDAGLAQSPTARPHQAESAFVSLLATTGECTVYKSHPRQASHGATSAGTRKSTHLKENRRQQIALPTPFCQKGLRIELNTTSTCNRD